ncbi:tripartite tricarboxylate transporter substrate-binding protein [Cupriavidus basilensis]|uniref:tripartite tricarboxylate transporter substrate-binding protein n=1 Tax=Cupriavidus basilensis TaxID=68895 RepID=UPI00284213F7|nr:tripartite tricarboxylate transporter substrate-binding protein [Cupriavidus basilensis]MDR3385395.1 tripartite tricarboxylate transporter substrate-binding protein [Cupriavidus basilensis]
MFRKNTVIAVLHLPYTATTKAKNDVVGGQVPILFGTLPTLAPFIRSGALRALAVTQATRSPAAPAIPSLAEQGVRGIEVSSWYALLVPRATPAPVGQALYADVREVFSGKAVREELARQGMEPVASTPDVLAARIRQESASWAELIRARGIKAE